MAFTTRATKAIGTFGVYGRPTSDEREVLELANEFRAALCAIYHQRLHDRINFRNDTFPQLYVAMVEKERAASRVLRLEKEIKAHHSKVRDRNAVTAPQEEQLLAAQEVLAAAMATLRREKIPFNRLLREYSAVFKAAGVAFTGEETAWKTVKSLARRREAYAAIVWPEHLRAYAEIMLQADLALRELDQEYQSRGLHSSIRGEIHAASRPKLKKDGPGMKYRYGRPLQLRPWRKLTLQFGAGGLPVARAMCGGTPQFSMQALYTNSKRSGDETVYRVRQQIGNRNQPRLVEYDVKLHRELPADALLQRWSLVIDGNRRKAIPVVSNMDFVKPTGRGLLTYDLSWRRVRGGFLVCTFLGDHVQEQLVLPTDLIIRRLSMMFAQSHCDAAANALLRSRGISTSKAPGSRHGVCALEDYVVANPADTAAGNQFDRLLDDLDRAKKTAAKARRTIEKIYETVAYRVCRLHQRLLADSIDLSRIKRYDTRDLLRRNAMPTRVRRYLHALAPGKLQALLRGYGLQKVASDEVPADFAGVARMTDLFSTYVNELWCKTGPKIQLERRRSRNSNLGDVG